MVRQKTIFCKLNSILQTDRELLDTAMQALRIDMIACPRCGAKACCREHGSYWRWMTTIECGKRIDCSIEIPRVFCESCGHTHAIIPDVLIPYQSYSLRFILSTLSNYLQRKCTVSAFCDQWQIAVSTLYLWKHLFLEQASLWLGKLEQVNILCEKLLNRMRDVKNFPAEFFEQFRFSFLQNRKTTKYMNSS